MRELGWPSRIARRVSAMQSTRFTADSLQVATSEASTAQF
jgi:hypothetical protein